MLRSLYIAGTGMLAQRKKLDVSTNNITNIETVGYKKDSLITQSFEDMLVTRMNDPVTRSGGTEVGAQNFGLHVDEVVTRFDQGSLEPTGRLSDVALQGDGFFAIAAPQGERYTRNGAFAVSRFGYLITEDGHYVAGETGRVFVGDGDFSIDAQGNVMVDGAVSNKLRIVTFADNGVLRKDGSNLFIGNGAQVAQNVNVKQGSLENSNVQIAEEMVNVMTMSRNYETNQRIVKMVDESLSKSVNEVGRV